MDFGTKPEPEHEWLQQLVGEWKVESEMIMPEGEPLKAEGRESVKSFGGLFAFSHGSGDMPNGEQMEYYSALGWDVSFLEYRYTWVCNVSSHIWQYRGTLSEDGKTMTLDCEGPHMEKDGETANYRDVMTIVDANHRTYTSSGQDDEGNWHQFMQSTYTRL
jgi:hypothetical protein